MKRPDVAPTPAAGEGVQTKSFGRVRLGEIPPEPDEDCSPACDNGWVDCPRCDRPDTDGHAIEYRRARPADRESGK